MSLTLSQASLPSFRIALAALSEILDKAEAFVVEKKLRPSVLLNMRLAPVMLTFLGQVQMTCDQARAGAARLAGDNPPAYRANETTISELRERISNTLAYLSGVDSAKIDAASEQTITFPMGPEMNGQMKGKDYLRHFILPNFYFHLTVAYAILRHGGVEVGKNDFLGAIPIRLSGRQLSTTPDVDHLIASP